MHYDDGVPKYSDVEKGLLYAVMKGYSDRFLALNESTLKKYYWPKWSKDPLSEWSRRYEYPYVISKSLGTHVLDAGAGVTFFPWYLAENSHAVTAYDLDKYFFYAYKEINERMFPRVEFKLGDIDSLPYCAGVFSSVVCISVLEHTGNHDRIIDEFYRVLRPGGRLVATFDIDLRGDFSVEKGIIEAVQKKFMVKLPDLPDDYGDRLRTHNEWPGIRDLSVYCFEAVKPYV